MAISLTQRTDLITVLVGLFDAAPSSELMTTFVNAMDSGATVDSFVNDWTSGAEFTSLYPVWLTNEEFATNFVNNLLGDNVDAATKTAGQDFVLAQINAGSTQGEAAVFAIRALAAVDVADPTWGQAAQQLQNKVDVATYFATTQDVSGASFAELRSVTANVTADATTVADKKVLIDADLDSAMQILTTGQDILTGSAGNDGFRAWIFDNQNTAQSGDYINGGAGRDTLSAEIGNSQKFAISLKTDSVEVAEFRAQAQATDSADNDPTAGGADAIDGNTQIDAGDMNGTVEFWNTDSRANLVIEDVQADSHTVTVGWRNADAGEVNYEVYFDNITAPGSSTAGSQLFLELLDLDGMRTDGEPLKDNPYTGVQFSLDGTVYNITADNPVQTTYADLVAAINAGLQNEGLTNVTASLGSTFSAINSKDGLSYQGTTIVLTNSGPETLDGIGWIVDGVLPPDSNVHTQIDNVAPTTDTQLTQTDVIFDYVGSGSKAGSFVAGEMSQAGGSNSGTPGIQQFNIDVDRDSWVQEVRSTEDTLEEVFVESIGANGTLRIDELNDVKVFDASAMQNSVTLTAELSEGVIAKYLDKTDTASALPAADNDTFNYITAGSDDTVTLVVSEEASAHEDFELNVSTAGGNDTLTVSLKDNSSLDGNWYADQHGLKNITLSTGDGNDTITSSGEGDAKIVAGNGNDTVYTDNSGAQAALVGLPSGTTSKAAWVFNADTGVAVDDGNNIDDLAGATLTQAWLHDVTVTVTLSESASAAGAATTNGFESAAITVPVENYVGTQANINQAIKEAINSDAVLSKLLKAEDGADNTLVVTSLIDGVFAADDLQVDLAGPTWTNYSAAEQASLNTAYNAFKQDSDTDLDQAAIDAELALVNTASYATEELLEDGADTAIVGAASTVASDNEVHLGNGNDVAVLGTLEGGDELGSSNDTLVFDDAAFGNNTIVNFDINGNGIDQLDFTAILDTNVRTSASASTESLAEADIEYTDNTLEANDVFAVSFVAAGNDTWAGLTAAELLDALNGDGAYANLVAGTANSVNAAAGFGTDDGDVADTAQDHVLLVENAANQGEYKVFKLTSVSDAAANVDAGDFATAELLGTVDFGATTALTTANFV